MRGYIKSSVHGGCEIHSYMRSSTTVSHCFASFVDMSGRCVVTRANRSLQSLCAVYRNRSCCALNGFQSWISYRNPLIEYQSSLSPSFSGLRCFSDVRQDGTQSKWPGPTASVHKTLGDQTNKVFLGEIGNLDVPSLKALLAEFGEVLSVNIPLLNKYRTNPSRYSNRYAFAVFVNSLGKQKALHAGTVGDGIVIAEVMPRASSNPASVYVEGFPAPTKEEDLTLHFSQFGEVKKTTILHIRGKLAAFVDFDSAENASYAISHGQHIILEKPVLVAHSTSRAGSTEGKVVMADNLPKQITVGQLHDYFIAYGPVKIVNLVLDHQDDKLLRKNFAFISFATDADISPLFSNDLSHVIGDHPFSVRKAYRTRQTTSRACKVLVKGLTTAISESQIIEHFNQFDEVKSVNLMRNSVTDMLDGTALIEYANQSGASKASEDLNQELSGYHIQVRQLGFSVE